MAPTAVFIGAHPDDIEIGAGGTAAKLVHDSWSVFFCILTSDVDAAVARIRRDEARRAASLLGVEPDRLVFVDLPDKALENRGAHIDRARDAIASRMQIEDANLFFAHSPADVHSDHLAAHGIASVIARGKPLLEFPVINHLVLSRFDASIFVDVSAFRELKLRALAEHSSQVEEARVPVDAIEEFSTRLSRGCPGRHAEAFALERTYATDASAVKLARSLNDRRVWRSRGFRAALAALVASVAAFYLLALARAPNGSQGSIELQEFVRNSHISGRVVGVPPERYKDLKVLVYVLTDKWYVHPWSSPEPGGGYAAISEDGSWRIATQWREHQASRLALILTERTTVVPPVVSAVGGADRAILSRVNHLAAEIMKAPEGI